MKLALLQGSVAFFSLFLFCSFKRHCFCGVSGRFHTVCPFRGSFFPLLLVETSILFDRANIRIGEVVFSFVADVAHLPRFSFMELHQFTSLPSLSVRAHFLESGTYTLSMSNFSRSVLPFPFFFVLDLCRRIEPLSFPQVSSLLSRACHGSFLHLKLVSPSLGGGLSSGVYLHCRPGLILTPPTSSLFFHGGGPSP